jgi:hypothetical protein
MHDARKCRHVCLHSPRPELVGVGLCRCASHELHGVDHGRMSCSHSYRSSSRAGLCQTPAPPREADRARARAKGKGQGPGRRRRRGRSLLQRCWMRVGVPVGATKADMRAGPGGLLDGLGTVGWTRRRWPTAPQASSRTRASGSIRFRSSPSMDMDMIPDSRFQIPKMSMPASFAASPDAQVPGLLPTLPRSTALQLQAINPLVQRRPHPLSCRHRRCRPASRTRALTPSPSPSPAASATLAWP